MLVETKNIIFMADGFAKFVCNAITTEQNQFKGLDVSIIEYTFLVSHLFLP